MTTNEDSPTPAPRRLNAMWAALRWTELLALYWVLPFLVDFTQRWQGRLLIPGLLLGGVVLFTILWRSTTFDRRSLWNFPAFRRELPRILITGGLAFVVMLVISWWLSNQLWAPTFGNELFSTDWSNPLIWMILIFYPLLSVYPQEIILRTFFFHRYAPLFGGGRATIVASALTFAWVHVIFVGDKSDVQQWVPVFICIPGGLLFGYTYWKTKSTIASAAEHALVGNLMWLSGLGWYFFAGGAVANGG